MLFLAVGCATSSDTRTPVDEVAADDPGYLSNADVLREPDKVICRRHKPTGSRLSEKICMTARQWQQMSEDSRSILEQSRRAPRTGID